MKETFRRILKIKSAIGIREYKKQKVSLIL